MKSKINYYILIPKGEWERFSKSLNKAVVTLRSIKLKKPQLKRQGGDNGYSGEN